MVSRYCLIIILVLLLILVSYSQKQELFKDSKRDYLTFDVRVKAGLSHQLSNLLAMIKEAYFTNQKLIIPELYLVGHHNNNNELKTNLSKYYDYSKLTINGKPYKVYLFKDKSISNNDIEKRMISNQLVRFDRSIKYSDRNIDIDLPYNKNIIDIAYKISSKLNNYLCIHVRRGDMLPLKKNLREDTSIKNLKKKINKYRNQVDNIYIMTNESDKEYLKELKKIKNLYLFSDFEELNNIDDNYYLFCIENKIIEKAKIKISTFNAKNNQTGRSSRGNKYDDSLSPLDGWQ